MSSDRKRVCPKPRSQGTTTRAPASARMGPTFLIGVDVIGKAVAEDAGPSVRGSIFDIGDVENAGSDSLRQNSSPCSSSASTPLRGSSAIARRADPCPAPAFLCAVAIASPSLFFFRSGRRWFADKGNKNADTFSSVFPTVSAMMRHRRQIGRRACTKPPSPPPSKVRFFAVFRPSTPSSRKQMSAQAIEKARFAEENGMIFSLFSPKIVSNTRLFTPKAPKAGSESRKALQNAGDFSPECGAAPARVPSPKGQTVRPRKTLDRTSVFR